MGERTLTLPVPPSANRWWRSVKGRVLLSREARAYKIAAATRALLAGFRPVGGPVALDMHWYRERKVGDLDKRLGVLLDAMQGVLYHNDSQLVRLVAERHDDPENPRVELTLTAVEG